MIARSIESSESKLKAWKNDLQEEIPTEEWNKACNKAQIQTANTCLKLLQYNWVEYTLHQKNSNLIPTFQTYVAGVERTNEHFSIVYGKLQELGNIGKKLD